VAIVGREHEVGDLVGGIVFDGGDGAQVDILRGA
jgi:hypothetical protein